jgi:hypothetical protein
MAGDTLLPWPRNGEQYLKTCAGKEHLDPRTRGVNRSEVHMSAGYLVVKK